VTVNILQQLNHMSHSYLLQTTQTQTIVHITQQKECTLTANNSLVAMQIFTAIQLASIAADDTEHLTQYRRRK